MKPKASAKKKSSSSVHLAGKSRSVARRAAETSSSVARRVANTAFSLTHRVYDAVIVKDGVAKIVEAKRSSRRNEFALCIFNADYPVSLEPMKVYVILRDDFADEHDLVRVVDETGEDYLYPEEYFVRLQTRGALRKTLEALAEGGLTPRSS